MLRRCCCVVDDVRAEVERREKMPTMTATCRVPKSGQKQDYSIKAWEEIAKSVARGLGVLAVARVSFCNGDVEPLLQRWLELGVEEGATVNASGLVNVKKGAGNSQFTVEGTYTLDLEGACQGGNKEFWYQRINSLRSSIEGSHAHPHGSVRSIM